MMTLYAIGDIHGQDDMLGEALAWIEADGGRDARVIFLGDFVDRGPASSAVIERLARGLAEGRDWVPLLGNHDRMFRRFLASGSLHDGRILSGKGWLNPALGGDKTLASYGVTVGKDSLVEDIHVEALARVPEHHRALLDGLKVMHREEGLIFVHAGLRPRVAPEDQDEDDLIWIRDDFLNWTRSFEGLVVHGHTPVEAPTHYGNRVNLDTGAGYGRPLSVGVFEAGEVFSLTEFGRATLR